LGGHRDPVDPEFARSIPFPPLSFLPVHTSAKNGLQINVMSYNVLAYGNDTKTDFTYVSKENLNFNYRAPRVIKEIKEANADILCLQELNNIANFYKPELNSLGYELVFDVKITPYPCFTGLPE
jgi:mRNA deadenylase 3'-5' endonuclease subunit Ccr4